MMVKSITHSFFIVMLVFSILAPSVIPLLVDHNDQVVFVDFSEEENKKESKKELKEKEYVVNDFVVLSTQIYDHKSALNVSYLASYPEVGMAIFLPPPEHNS